MSPLDLTTIRHNGGGNPEPIDALFDRLETATLDPKFNGCELPGNDGEPWRFHGNFYDYSHVFIIDTTDAILAERLLAAMEVNKARPEYAAAKAEQAERKARADQRQFERDRERQEEREKAARGVLGLAA